MSAFLLALLGLMHVVGGLAVFDQRHFYEIPETGQGTMTHHDITGWAVAHLALGAVLLLVAVGAAIGQRWVLPVGVTLAVLSAVAGFFFLAYQPFWALLTIALDVAVIAVLLAGRSTRRRQRPRRPVAAHRRSGPRATPD